METSEKKLTMGGAQTLYNDLRKRAASADENLAPYYDATQTYAVGDMVMYKDNLYECSTAITTAEAWTAAHWTQCSLATKMSDVNNVVLVQPSEPSDAGNKVWIDSDTLEETSVPTMGDIEDLESDVDALQEDVVGLNSAIVKLDATKDAVTGIYNVLTPMKIVGLNMPTNGTAYVSGSNYETFYIPIKAGRMYKWVTNKTSGNPSLRLSVASSVPANGVACTFLEEEAVYSTPVIFTYTASDDGYLSISVWKGQVAVSTMTVTETQYGELHTITGDIDAVTDMAENRIFVGTETRTVEFVDNKIQARKLIYYEGTPDSNVWPGGLAIYKNLAFIAYHTGYIAVFDLCSGALVATGRTPQTSSHQNTAFFDTHNIIDGFPPLYISYCSAGVTYCYVYSVAISNGIVTTTFLQRIQYAGEYCTSSETVDWCYDEYTDELVALISDNVLPLKILRFKKPVLFNRVVRLTDSDVITAATNSDMTTRQSCTISCGHVFVLDGLSSGYLRVINTSTGATINSISLAPADTHEPEGIAIANGKVYVNFHVGQNMISANLYELTF